MNLRPGEQLEDFWPARVCCPGCGQSRAVTDGQIEVHTQVMPVLNPRETHTATITKPCSGSSATVTKWQRIR